MVSTCTIQGLRRRPLTAALIVIPCILSILTLLSAWILPSSRFSGDHESPTTLESHPKISDPTGKKGKKANNKASDNSNDNTAVATNTSISKKENWTMVPQKLLDLGVYDETLDFVNEMGIKPTGWEHPNGNPNVWGPCRFEPLPQDPTTTTNSLEWKDRRRWPPSSSSSNNDTISADYYRNADVQDFEYLRESNEATGSSQSGAMGGWCRPGFLIIGAGKCGTSSLYHYLIGHPRVLPAIQKQIHYFKYLDKRKPLEWYYGYFPTPQSFLEHGGLVTGEASPGYLPYPVVAKNAYKAWKGSLSIDGAGKGSTGRPLSDFLANPRYKSMVPEVSPRIIALGREPFDRIYSSYKYNYVVPTIELLRTKGHPRIPTGKNKSYRRNENGEFEEVEGGFELHREDEYYSPYLFTLEEFIRAELKQLRGCLHDWGPEKTYTKWHNDNAYKEAIKTRNGDASNVGTHSNASLSQPLIDLDGICYGGSISRTVYRAQWTEMQTNNPQKVLINRNLHLTQAFIGRSLYVFPLEWWYVNFRPDPNDASTRNAITFVCTEDLNTVETLNELTEILGLPKFDGFENVLAEGAYNVGGHRGYDKATSWEDLEHEQQVQNKTLSGEDGVSSANETGIPMTNGIPLPEDLYQELKDFIDPFNERLFALVGKRCDW